MKQMPGSKYEKFGKRLFDIVFSFCGLTLLSPIFVMMSLLIKIGSPGPIFFFQERMGKGGDNFKLIKFRSMHTDLGQEKKGFTPGDETRITGLGRYLRKTKIDELPELINVLKGNMSLVGPRPEVSEYRHIYVGKFEAVLSLRPGLTDPASIKYRNEEELLAKSPDPEATYINEILPDKLEINLKYTGNINFWNDLKILVKTVVKVIFP